MSVLAALALYSGLGTALVGLGATCIHPDGWRYGAAIIATGIAIGLPGAWWLT